MIKRLGVRWRGPRSLALIGLALVALSRALTYLPVVPGHRDVPDAIMALTRGTPLTITGWGAMWLVLCVLLVLGGLMRSSWQQLSMGLLTGMTAATSAAYLYSWALLFPPDNGEWAGGIFYAGFTIALVALIRQDKRLPRPAKEVTP